MWVYAICWVVIVVASTLILIDFSRLEDGAAFWRELENLWIKILPFFIASLLHHFLALRLLAPKRWAYILCVLILTSGIGVVQFSDPDRPRPPRAEQTDSFRPGPPPGEEIHPGPSPDSLFGPPPAREGAPDLSPDGPRPGPPPKEGPPEGRQHRRPIEPEFTLILLALFMFCADAGLRLFFEHRRKEKQIQELRKEADAPKKEAEQVLYFKSDYHLVKVPVSDIIYVQSMGEYIKIYRRSDAMPLITLYGIARLASELPEGQFVRTHRSYIVARSAIEKTSRSEVVLTGGTTLPVSATYKDALSPKA
ncbi:MAG: LytTR family transcriptional regulator [Bacteroidales bacterium]|nr:LytTR family transcriptional regulator [Bacteroidales bacterium]